MTVVEQVGGACQLIVVNICAGALVRSGIVSELPEDPSDVQPFPTFFEERAHRMPHVVRLIHATGKREALAIAVQALELSQTRDDFRLQIYGPVTAWSNETGGRRADAFDRL